MAKHQDDAPKADRAAVMELTAAVDPMIRSHVQGVLLADQSISFEDAVRKVTNGIKDGIIAVTKPAPAATRMSRDGDIAPPVGTQVVVRRTGWLYGGRTLDRGQVFALTGLRGDGKLLRLGYIDELPPSRTLETCGTCGAQFIDAATATAHFETRHAPKPEIKPTMEPRRHGETLQEYEQREAAWRAAIVAQEAAEDERAEHQENQRAPLYLENTTASRS